MSEATYKKLTEGTAAGETVSGFARRVLERALELAELPSLTPEGGRRIERVDVVFDPVLEAIAALREEQRDRSRETLRAVHEHGSWARRRIEPKGNAVLDQLARDDAEQRVRDWERMMDR